jgi:hypothetical protein
MWCHEKKGQDGVRALLGMPGHVGNLQPEVHFSKRKIVLVKKVAAIWNLNSQKTKRQSRQDFALIKTI